MTDQGVPMRSHPLACRFHMPLELYVVCERCGNKRRFLKVEADLKEAPTCERCGGTVVRLRAEYAPPVITNVPPTVH